ncbi:MAG: cysteine desulfurase NifS [Gemmatimonadetes bacterium]|nr:cysteine desulfurase NifS [Gemmatimonadota bacterium]
MTIYLDNAATTRPDPAVVAVIVAAMRASHGNASSVHGSGVRAAMALERARATISARLGCRSDELVFTSGGTESNNLALKGVAARQAARGGGRIVTTRIEHPSVARPVEWLGEQGFEPEFLQVDDRGFVDPDDLRKALRRKTAIVSIAQGNGEVGTIQAIAELGAICRAAGALFHVDASQSYTKVPVDVDAGSVDLLTISAHKIHGPLGVGALYFRRGVALDPLLHGGGHEGGLRSGSSNVPGIAGFGKAVEIAGDAGVAEMARLRDRFIGEVRERISGVLLNGPTGEHRLCNNINLCIDGVEGRTLQADLSRRGIAISTGSACSSTVRTPSEVLTAMGLDEQKAHTAVRITLSKWTTEAELDQALAAIEETVERERGR